MSFEEHFLYPLLLIVAGGAVSGIMIPWYTNRQKKRELEVEHGRADHEFKIKLKQELLETFHNYQIKKFYPVVILKSKLFYHYSIGNVFIDSTNPIIRKSRVNITPELYESARHEIISTWKTSQADLDLEGAGFGNLLLMKLEWYTKDKENLKEKFQNIRTETANLITLLNNLIECKTTSDFVNNLKIFTKTELKIYDLVAEFQKDLVALEINKLPV